jgi:hypothetical protein
MKKTKTTTAEVKAGSPARGRDVIDKDEFAHKMLDRIYTPAEEKKIKRLSIEVEKEKSCIFPIGRICHELVELNGVRYGDKTLQRIARHPLIKCSSRHLRRCWNAYRLSLHGKAIGASFRSLDKCILYELGRFLKAKLTDDDLIRIVRALVAQIVKDELTVDATHEVVNRRLDELGKLRRPPKAKQDKSEQPAEKPPASPEDVMELAETINRLCSHPERITSGEIKRDELSRALVCAVREILPLAEMVSRCGRNEEVGTFLVNQARLMDQIGRKLSGRAAA